MTENKYMNNNALTKDKICKDEKCLLCNPSEKIKLEYVRKAVEQTIKDFQNYNPYPEDIFIEKTAEEWKAFHKALKNAGLKSDGFMGCYSRIVWNNAVSTHSEDLKENFSAVIKEEKK